MHKGVHKSAQCMISGASGRTKIPSARVSAVFCSWSRQAEDATRRAQTGVVSTVTSACAPATETVIPARPATDHLGNPREPSAEADKPFQFEDPFGILKRPARGRVFDV